MIGKAFFQAFKPSFFSQNGGVLWLNEEAIFTSARTVGSRDVCLSVIRITEKSNINPCMQELLQK